MHVEGGQCLDVGGLSMGAEVGGHGVTNVSDRVLLNGGWLKWRRL